MSQKIHSVLVANRSEIAIRIMRAANELGMRTVGIYAHEDRLALHRFKADESYLVGQGRKPIAAYLDIEDIIRIAKAAKVDAVHPGYGFLSENPDFAQACADAGLVFIGPAPGVMRELGNKVAARALAQRVGVPVVPATGALPADEAACLAMAAQIGYPLMLKASWGGGGCGMRAIEKPEDLLAAKASAQREALAAFGNDEVYVEKMVQRAHHVEVQILGDMHGALVHVFERDCSVQRRNQKVVERAPAPYLSPAQRQALCDAALQLARGVGYTQAGTVEFLLDADSGAFYFIEVNPRIQVEHTVTEEVTGVDLLKAQLLIAQGGRIGGCPYLPAQEQIQLNGHALQCRVTTEDPARDFAPDHGKLAAYRSAAGAGIRLDAGTAYAGAVISPYYDSLLVKVTARGRDAKEATRRMARALGEFRIRGVATNLAFLEGIVTHPHFQAGSCTTRFIEQTPALLHCKPKQDRATRLLRFVGDVSVNGHPEMQGRSLPALPLPVIELPKTPLQGQPPAGSKQRLQALGAAAFAQSLLAEKRLLLTDTTLRDAHQSLFATRLRTADMLPIAPHYAHSLPQLFSLECWGGATFDVALRFLKEDPWARLAQTRQAVPNVLLQMLLRGANAVGYANYADNVVRHFVQQAAAQGMDVFRVFDSLNWVENMRVAMDAVQEAGALCEGTICYTGDMLDASRSKYALKYYVDMAKQLEKAGAHLIGIKDMAGLCRPAAASALVKALKEEVGLPLHFHTHDSSGAGVASVLAAAAAGVDVVDCAMDAMSGLNSQPSMGAIVAALQHGERDTGIVLEHIAPISRYWAGVRRQYAPFESDMRAGSAEVYSHEMPGGQYSNLREQARSMGLAAKWDAVVQAYAAANVLLGDIVKVTPSSKVVGDLALFMVANDYSAADIANPDLPMAFPDSVVAMMRGELGYPEGGFPPALQAKILQGQTPIQGRAGAHLPPVDLAAERARAEEILGHSLDDAQLASWLMYPKVYQDYSAHRRQFGDVAVLPTPVFFYGMALDENADAAEAGAEEISVDIEPGKTLVIRLLGQTPSREAGHSRLLFELNGQPRPVRVAQRSSGEHSNLGGKPPRAKAEAGNSAHVAAPMPGIVAQLAVRVGQRVQKGQALLSVEAMKMENAIAASRDGVVAAIHIAEGEAVQAQDLLLEYAVD